VLSEPRRRTQIKRYGHDEAVMDISDLEDTSGDSDEDAAVGVGRGRGEENYSVQAIELETLADILIKR